MNGKANMLLIDDDPVALDCMKYLLSASGHLVQMITDGGQALAAAQAHNPDLILCDAQLPNLSGEQLARLFKADATLQSVPLIAVTASAMPGDRERLLAAGFDGYFSKPIVPETFVEQVEAYLPTLKRSAATQTSRKRETMIVDMARQFAIKFPELLARIRAAISAGEIKSLQRAAHKALGSCIFFREPRLIDALRRLEKINDLTDLPRCEALLREVENQAHAVIQEIQSRSEYQSAA